MGERTVRTEEEKVANEKVSKRKNQYGVNLGSATLLCTLWSHFPKPGSWIQLNFVLFPEMCISVFSGSSSVAAITWANVLLRQYALNAALTP